MMTIVLTKIYHCRYGNRAGFSQVNFIFAMPEIRSRSSVDDL
jgi:hypothetical protein